MGLVISRMRDETLVIGDDIEVTIADIRGDRVRLLINAPKEIPIHRKEVVEAIRRNGRRAAQVKPEALATTPTTRETIEAHQAAVKQVKP